MDQKEFSVLGKAVSGINIETAEIYQRILRGLDNFLHGDPDQAVWGLLVEDLKDLVSRNTELWKSLWFLRNSGKYENLEEITECIESAEESLKFQRSLLVLSEIYID